jgi:hypothetical protein
MIQIDQPAPPLLSREKKDGYLSSKEIDLERGLDGIDDASYLGGSEMDGLSKREQDQGGIYRGGYG